MEKSGFIPVNGVAVAYEESGDGPVLLLHAGVANLRQWDPRPRLRRALPRDPVRQPRLRRIEASVEFSNHGDLERHRPLAWRRISSTSRSASIALNFTVTRNPIGSPA